jgi:hypothetical protein
MFEVLVGGSDCSEFGSVGGGGGGFGFAGEHAEPNRHVMLDDEEEPATPHGDGTDDEDNTRPPHQRGKDSKVNEGGEGGHEYGTAVLYDGLYRGSGGGGGSGYASWRQHLRRFGCTCFF